MQRPSFTVKIDHLPEEGIEADTPREAARAVTAMIRERSTLQALPDDEAVQIKRPDHRPWGRHLTLGDFRHGDIAETGDDEDGPVRDAEIHNYYAPGSTPKG